MRARGGAHAAWLPRSCSAPPPSLLVAPSPSSSPPPALMPPPLVAPSSVAAKRLSPWFETGAPLASLAPVYNFACTIITSAAINYLVCSFVVRPARRAPYPPTHSHTHTRACSAPFAGRQVLAYDRAIAVWSRMLFIPHVVFVLALLALRFVPRPKAAKQA